MYFYPEIWVEPTPPAAVVLTEAQRANAKTLMQNYLNNQNRKISARELVDTCQNYVRNTYHVHISDQIILEIAIEIQHEWHPEMFEPPEE